MWALDVVGPLQKMMENSNKKAFILTAMDYFMKWAEAEPFVEIEDETPCKFIEKNIIARFRIPKAIIADNGPHFVSSKVKRLCKKYKIELHNSSAYYSQENSQAEATTKTPHDYHQEDIGDKDRAIGQTSFFTLYWLIALP